LVLQPAQSSLETKSRDVGIAISILGWRKSPLISPPRSQDHRSTAPATHSLNQTSTWPKSRPRRSTEVRQATRLKFEEVVSVELDLTSYREAFRTDGAVCLRNAIDPASLANGRRGLQLEPGSSGRSRHYFEFLAPFRASARRIQGVEADLYPIGEIRRTKLPRHGGQFLRRAR
jgi:hypothetical protein